MVRSTKLVKSISAGLLVLVLSLGGIWVLVDHFTAPPPSGEPYRLVTGWPRLPEGEGLGQVSGVGVDSTGKVFVFRRADRIWQGEEIELGPIAAPTVLIFAAETGELVGQWGANTLVMPHSLTVDGADNIWLTDVGLHQVFKFDGAGKLLMALGEPGVPGDDEAHFNMPTDVAVAPDGSFYVSDGYGNSRVVRFGPDGRFMAEWGTKGTEPGQFDVPHSVALDAQGRVYVADRGNARLQIFDEGGQFVAAWQGAELGRPWAVRLGPDGSVYVVDGGDQPEFWPDRARILKFDASGAVRASFGAFGSAAGQLIWPHTIALGPDGALYVGEVSTGMRVQKFSP